MTGDRIDIQQFTGGVTKRPTGVMGWVLLAGSTLQQIDVTVAAHEFTANEHAWHPSHDQYGPRCTRLPEGNDGYRHGDGGAPPGGD